MRNANISIERGAEFLDRAISSSSTSSATSSSSNNWPEPLADAAFHGIAGEFVRMVEPNTEADPTALLLQFLVAFGALVGRGPHYKVEADEHHGNLFTVLVGQTSKARKGTAKGRVREPFPLSQIGSHRLAACRPARGSSTTSGTPARKPKTKAGESVTEVVDDGVIDKRLLVIEPEFAAALRYAQRPG